MAVTLGKSPIIMGAQGDSVANDGRNWCVTAIKAIATGGGEFVLKDISGGRTIYRSGTLSAGETDETAFDGHWFDGFYLDQSPGGELHIYYK